MKCLADTVRLILFMLVNTGAGFGDHHQLNMIVLVNALMHISG